MSTCFLKRLILKIPKNSHSKSNLQTNFSLKLQPPQNPKISHTSPATSPPFNDQKKSKTVKFQRLFAGSLQRTKNEVKNGRSANHFQRNGMPVTHISIGIRRSDTMS